MKATLIQEIATKLDGMTHMMGAALGNPDYVPSRVDVELILSDLLEITDNSLPLLII